MLRRFKLLAVTSAVFAAAIAIFPAPSGAAVAAAACQARDVVKLEEWSHTAAVTGVYTSAGATDVRLTCGIVQNGTTVIRISESVPGPVAAIATTTNISGQYYSVCYEVNVTYVDHTSNADTCP
ncbi:MAG TPA: hypothetical protein VE174_01440 [Actinomycetota bacterium]|nr:hypothetical protein [Actinomycetota bacterium]